MINTGEISKVVASLYPYKLEVRNKFTVDQKLQNRMTECLK